MRNLLLFVLLSSFLLIFSCGGNDKTEQQESKAAPAKKLSLSTQEGMVQKLKEFGIEIPDYFVFNEIKRTGDGGHRIKYTFQTSDHLTDNIKSWVNSQKESLLSKGWTINDYPHMLGEALWFKKKFDHLVIAYYIGGSKTLGEDPSAFYITLEYSEIY